MGEAGLPRKGIKCSYGGQGREKLEWGHQKGRREKKKIRGNKEWLNLTVIRKIVWKPNIVETY